MVMSCYGTAGGTLVMRLARAYSGLSQSTLQKLFHGLKREGANLPEPTAGERDLWRARQQTLIKHAPLPKGQRERSERDLFHAGQEDLPPGVFYALSNLEVRARQEAVLREIKGQVVDLAPPGSQAHLYDLDEEGRPKYVWYASYGSNMDAERFDTYVTGGTPHGSNTHHQGCRDKTPPADDIPIRFEGRMHFAALSGRWGGGVAFMDNDHAGHALGRAYLVSIEQFDDIIAQENGKIPGTVTIDAGEVLRTGQVDVSTNLYGRMCHIGDKDGKPVLTFTGNFSAQEALEDSYSNINSWTSTTKPSPNYLRMIGRGLGETFGMDVGQQADYLRGVPGATTMTKTRLMEILSTPPDPMPKPKPRPVTSLPSSYARSWDTQSSLWDTDPMEPPDPRNPEPFEEDMWEERDLFVPSDYADHPSWLHDPYFSAKKPKERPQGTNETTSRSRSGPSVSGTPKPAGIPTGKPSPPPGVTWTRKICVICQSRDHDMHGCPRLASNNTPETGGQPPKPATAKKPAPPRVEAGKTSGAKSKHKRKDNDA